MDVGVLLVRNAGVSFSDAFIQDSDHKGVVLANLQHHVRCSTHVYVSESTVAKLEGLLVTHVFQF